MVWAVVVVELGLEVDIAAIGEVGRNIEVDSHMMAVLGGGPAVELDEVLYSSYIVALDMVDDMMVGDTHFGEGL